MADSHGILHVDLEGDPRARTRVELPDRSHRFQDVTGPVLLDEQEDHVALGLEAETEERLLLLEALAAQIERGQRGGRVSSTLHPFTAAAALGSLLEKLSAHAGELAHRGISRDDLIETCAAIVYQVVTGQRPD